MSPLSRSFVAVLSKRLLPLFQRPFSHCETLVKWYRDVSKIENALNSIELLSNNIIIIIIIIRELGKPQIILLYDRRRNILQAATRRQAHYKKVSMKRSVKGSIAYDQHTGLSTDKFFRNTWIPNWSHACPFQTKNWETRSVILGTL